MTKKTLGSTVEMLIIEFDQEKFEQLLSIGNTSLLCVLKHRKISLTKAPLDDSWKHASGEADKALSKPIIASGEAN